MTIQWRYTTHDNLGILSVAGHLGGDAVDRFTGAVGWVTARGTGPVVLDLTELRGWSMRRSARHRPGRPTTRRTGAFPGTRRDPGRWLHRPRRYVSADPRPL